MDRTPHWRSKGRFQICFGVTCMGPEYKSALQRVYHPTWSKTANKVGQAGEFLRSFVLRNIMCF